MSPIDIIIKRLYEDHKYFDDYDNEEEWATVAKQIINSRNTKWAIQFLEERNKLFGEPIKE